MNNKISPTVRLMAGRKGPLPRCYDWEHNGTCIHFWSTCKPETWPSVFVAFVSYLRMLHSSTSSVNSCMLYKSTRDVQINSSMFAHFNYVGLRERRMCTRACGSCRDVDMCMKRNLNAVSTITPKCNDCACLPKTSRSAGLLRRVAEG
jgi:hypothetical protein